MIYADVCYLIKEASRGVFSESTSQRRKVFCTVRSVGRSEYYAADNVGLQPELVLKLARDKEYQNELTIEFREKKYSVIRNYRTPDGGIELTIQRSDVNA